MRIVWKGGATIDREVERFTPGGRAHATPLETVDLVRKLAQEFDDAQIARILNRQGRRSGLDRAFTKELAGQRLRLHPLQWVSVDQVVRGAQFEGATGSFTVPGRTAAVFVDEREHHR